MTSKSLSDTILGHLQGVRQERALREAEPELGHRAQQIREYQAERLRSTHADLLGQEQTRPAALFFLDQLYGTQDFVERDAQFARIVPAIVRLFSAEVGTTVAHLAELHALSERLDSAMARALPDSSLASREAYETAWRVVGLREQRERQLDLVEIIGRALQHYTQHPSLGRALTLMRFPARAAGLHALQQFLETGFDTFARLPSPAAFMQTIVTRERSEMHRLFGDDADGPWAAAAQLAT
ncbi:MAG: FFLEELY motif protein [Rubrivivax sp.]